MATVRYTNIEGQIVAEKRGGVRNVLVPDAVNERKKLSHFRAWKTEPPESGQLSVLQREDAHSVATSRPVIVRLLSDQLRRGTPANIGLKK